MKNILRKIKKSSSNDSETKRRSPSVYSLHEKLDSSGAGSGGTSPRGPENDAEDENYPPSKNLKKSIIFSATPSKAASKEILNTLKSRASEISSFDQSELDLGTRYSKVITEKFPEDSFAELFMVFQVQIHSHKGKSAVSLLPVHLVMSKYRMFLFETPQEEEAGIVNSTEIKDIKELLLDNTRTNLICYYCNDEDNPIYLLVAEESLPNIIKHIEQARSVIFKGVPALVIKNLRISEDMDDIQQNVPSAATILEDLAARGVAGSDIWSGNLDLLSLVKNYNQSIPVKGEQFLIEFFFPRAPEFNGVLQKLFHVGNSQTILQVLESLCNKLGVKDHRKYCLATLNGKPLQSDATLLDYGVGILFNTWQLKLIETSNPQRTGKVPVGFCFPRTREFQVEEVRMAVDIHASVKENIIDLCADLHIPKPHRFQMSIDGIILNDDDRLCNQAFITQYKHRYVTISLKSFPVATGNAEQGMLNVSVKLTETDRKAVQEILDGLIENAYTIAMQRRKKKVICECEEIVNQMVNSAIESCLLAESIVSRILMLNPIHKRQLYMFLSSQEFEEASLLVPQSPRKEPSRPVPPISIRNSHRPSSADLSDARGKLKSPRGPSSVKNNEPPKPDHNAELLAKIRSRQRETKCKENIEEL